MEEEPVCGHSLHEVDTLVAEIAEVAGVCGGRLEAEGGGGDIARQLQGGVGLGSSLLLWKTGEERGGGGGGGGRQYSQTNTSMQEFPWHIRFLQVAIQKQTVQPH